MVLGAMGACFNYSRYTDLNVYLEWAVYADRPIFSFLQALRAIAPSQARRAFRIWRIGHRPAWLVCGGAEGIAPIGIRGVGGFA